MTTDTVSFEAVKLARKVTDLLVLGEYAVSDNPKVRTAAASNPSCPPEYLAYLSGDSATHVLNQVAQHPNTPPEILAVLAQNPKLSSALTSNENLTSDTLLVVLERTIARHRRDADWVSTLIVCANILESQNVTYSLARRIVTFTGAKYSVVEAFFKCPVIDGNLIEQMVNASTKDGEKEKTFDRAVAHTETPASALETIASSSDSKIFVRQRAVAALMKLPDYADWPVEWLYSQFGIE